MEGIYLINKPIGLSSFDCIRHLKKFTKEKIGHAGTLDPLASGLLIVLVGRATKLSSKFINFSKRYTGEITFGTSTNTYDKEGEIVKELKEFSLTNELINDSLKTFLGPIKQLPPLYSAIKVKGKKLYHYALQGEKIELSKRDVTVFDFKMTTPLLNNKFNFSTKVSKGTYIRSLAHDLGEKLNVPAHLSSLTRTEVDDFKLSEAYNLENIDVNTKPTYTIIEYLSKFPSIKVSGKLEKLVINGIYLDKTHFKEETDFLVYNNTGTLLAYYEPVKDKYKPVIIWGE